MRITHFFALLFALSLAIFVFLKPQEYDITEAKEIASVELEDFTLYKLTPKGVESFLSGTLGQQYKTHYDIDNAHYIKNENIPKEHLYADKGIFQNDNLYLYDNVRYFREDGLSLESDKATYYTKKEKLYIPDNFVLTQNENIVYGKELHYNSVNGKIKAQRIEANYYIEDKK